MNTISLLIYRLLDFYTWLIIIECFLSWMRLGGNTVIEDLYEALARLVEPYLNIFRRFIPPLMGVDFSPVVAILVLQLLEQLVL